MLDLIYRALDLILPSGLYAPMFMKRAALGLLLLALPTSGAGLMVVNLRMAFFSDAIGHSIFAGLALALIMSWPVQPALLGFGLMIGLLVVALSRRTKLASDTVIGVVFSGILALGLAVLSRDPATAKTLNRFLLGDILTIGDSEIVILLIMNVVSLLFLYFAFNPLILESLSNSLASSRSRWKGRFGPYIFGAFLALVVMVAVQSVGALLVTALLVVPAAASRNVARSAGGMLWLTFIVALVSGQAGLAISATPAVNTATGATIVLVAVTFFCLSLFGSRLSAWSRRS